MPAGTLTIVCSGDVGTPSFLAVDSCIHDGFLAVDDISDDCLLDYLYEVFRSLKTRLERSATHGGVFTNLTTDILREFAFLLPPLSEQRKIAEILRTWDEAIEKLEALRAAKSSRASGAVQILLAPSRAIGKHIPRTNWVTTLFAEAFEERQDRNDNLSPDDVVTVGKYAIRKQSEHFTRSVASSDLSNYRVISPGDFVYDPMSAYYGAIGRYQGTQDGIVSPAYRVIRLRDDIVPEFMVALLRSYPIRFQLDRKSSQGNKEGKRRIIQRDEFGSIEFNLPVLDIQRHIASVLVDFERDIALATDQLDALRRQKRGLMQKLLTGEWRVNPHD
jgi:type I restriction enzyme S subunit